MTLDFVAATAQPPLELALPDLDAWVAHFRRAEIPVLASTAETLEMLRAKEEQMDARTVAEHIGGDPLMTIKLLAHAGTHRPRRANADAETITAVLVLMGMGPFFRDFGPQPTVEERLQTRPPALDGLHAVLRRADRAAQFALAFAIHRGDPDAPVIHEAALLHDFAEMLLWCHAPSLALTLRKHQRAQPTRRSAELQRELLNVELADLQHALMLAWRLPELLVRITDHKHARHPNVKSVLLAIRLARHSADGWDNPALPDDVREIAELLTLAPEPTLELLHKLDA